MISLINMWRRLGTLRLSSTECLALEMALHEESERRALEGELAILEAAWRDAEGRPRVFSQPQPFATLLRASFDPIRIFAGTNPAIYARLLDSLTELSLVGARAEDQTALHRQAQLIRRAADAALTEPDDRAFVELRFEHAMKHFRGGVTSTRKSPAAARDPAAAPR